MKPTSCFSPADWPVASIVLAQLCGVSLWFSANSAADDLARTWHTTPADMGLLTSAVQLGFIVGTLAMALSGLADRFAASRIFTIAVLAGAVANAGFAFCAQGLHSALPWRFAVGVALAGVYPLGMKLVVGWQPQRAGSALGWLVGMLTLGSALPHALRTLGAALPWQWVVLGSSALALVAAVLVYRVGDGPHAALRRGAPMQLATALQAFRMPAFRAAALGYFGHMWEPYAFWTLVPMLVRRVDLPARMGCGDVPGWAFLVVGVGALGCVAGGALSQRMGSARVAALALGASGLCCLLFPWLAAGPAWLLCALLLVWGVAVVADSPQFSALAMLACAPAQIGSALALLTSIGFAITMVSIGWTSQVLGHAGVYVSWWLLPGPLLGLLALRPLLRRVSAQAA